MAAWHFTPARRRFVPPHPTPQHHPAARHAAWHRHAATPPERRRRRWTSWLRTFLVVFAVLLLIRAVLPIGVGWYVNRVLAGMKQYRGECEGVRLNLWRGSYEIDQLRLWKRGAASEDPLVHMRRLDISVQWQGLLRGRIVAEATAHHPVVEFVVLTDAKKGKRQKAEGAEEQQLGAGEPWGLHLDQLVPFELNRFVIRDGEIRFRNETTDPPVDIYMTDFYLEALNIANVRRKPGEEVLWSEIEAAGRPFGTAEFEGRMRFDPLADPLRMELDAAVRDVQLIDLNDYLRAYGKVDAEGGTLGVYAEFATTDGLLEGYVKTLFDRMRILRFEEINGPEDALEALWEGLIAVATDVIENQPHDRLATKIPLRGTTENAGADILATVSNLLRNAFFAALGPAIDDSIDLRDMEVAVPSAGAKGRPAKDQSSKDRSPPNAQGERRGERRR